MAFELERPEVGQVLNGKYRLERVLGEGVMGVVFQALNLRLGHSVAIKLPQALVLAEPSLRERFEREAKAAARLRHRNSARVLDVEVSEQGVPYMVMELLFGHDLERELELRPQLPVEKAVAYVVQACSAMAEAHDQGVVHRDLKPSNLFLANEADGSVCLKVLDFGISKFAQFDEASLTAPLVQVGTPLYMSPEQVRAAGSVDGRSDIWSLGIILYEALAGEPPFTGTSTSVGAAIVSDEPMPLSVVRPDVPPELASLVMRALQKDPAKRFESMRAMARALMPFAGPSPGDDLRASLLRLVPDGDSSFAPLARSSPTQTLAAAGGRASAARSRKRRTLLVGLALSFLAAAAGGAWFALRASEPEGVADRAARSLPVPRSELAAAAPAQPVQAASAVELATADALPSASSPSAARSAPVSVPLNRPSARVRGAAAAPPKPAHSGADAAPRAPARGWDSDSPLPPP